MKRRNKSYNHCASQYSRAVSRKNGARRYENEECKDYHHIDEKDLELIRKIWRKYNDKS